MPALTLALIRRGIITIPLAVILVFAAPMQVWGVCIAFGCGYLAAIPLAYV
jgi:hypothetical protein